MRNDLDEFRPILRTIGAVIFTAARTSLSVDDAYKLADKFLDRLDADLKAAENR